MTKFAKSVVDEVHNVRTETLRAMVTKLLEDIAQFESVDRENLDNVEGRLDEASDQCDRIRAYLSSTTDPVAQLSYYEVYCESCLAVRAAKHLKNFDTVTNRNNEWKSLTHMCLTTLPGKY
eukprot:Sspe_Gene.77151::Locus_48183_Transcript_1_1_Confidence_1.000_Length_361::g.77151::m.77151